MGVDAEAGEGFEGCEDLAGFEELEGEVVVVVVVWGEGVRMLYFVVIRVYSFGQQVSGLESGLGWFGGSRKCEREGMEIYRRWPSLDQQRALLYPLRRGGEVGHLRNPNVLQLSQRSFTHDNAPSEICSGFDWRVGPGPDAAGGGSILGTLILRVSEVGVEIFPGGKA